MRRREVERIARRRREYTNARRRLARANKSVSQLPTGAPDRQGDRLRLKAQSELEKARRAKAELEAAIRAPSRAKARDIDRRPDRYKNPRKAAAAVLKEGRKADAMIDKLVEAELTDQEAEARRLIEEAFRNGQSIDDVYKRIARESGLSEHAVYTMAKYADVDTGEAIAA